MRSLALPVDAEASFTQALSLARHQGALWWELRAAKSLARLWCASGRRREAVALLAPLRDRFDAVLETDDLRDAWLAVAESE
jgi:predicted ATPase